MWPPSRRLCWAPTASCCSTPCTGSPAGTALHGKELLLAVSVGGAGSAYGREGAHIYTIHEFLRPMQGTSRVIGTKYAVPFLSVGALEITDEAIARRAQDYAAVLQTPELPLLDIFG